MAVPEAATGTALILVDPDGQNEIGVALGANGRLTVDNGSAHEKASVAWPRCSSVSSRHRSPSSAGGSRARSVTA